MALLWMLVRPVIDSWMADMLHFLDERHLGLFGLKRYGAHIAAEEREAQRAFDRVVVW